MATSVTSAPSEIRARGVDPEAADWLRRFAAAKGVSTGEIINRMVQMTRGTRDTHRLLLESYDLEEPDL